MKKIPSKSILFLNLIVLLEASYICAGEPKSLVQDILTNPASRWKDLHQLPSQLIGLMILHNHPIVPFILNRSGIDMCRVHTVSRIYSAISAVFDQFCDADFNSSGDRVLTTSFDKTAKIWETNTGKCLFILKGHSDRVNSAVFSSLGDRCLSASRDRTVKLWETRSGECLHTLEGHSEGVLSAQFNSSGNQVVTASQDKTAKIWDTSTGECLRTLADHTGIVTSAKFNKSGDMVLTISLPGGTAKLWETSSGKCHHTLTENTDNNRTTWRADFNNSGDRVLTAHWDGTAKLWDTKCGECLHTLKGHTKLVMAVVFIDSGEIILTCSFDKTFKVWETRSGKCLQTLSLAIFYSDFNIDNLIFLKFNRSGEKIVTTYKDGVANLYDISQFLKLRSFFSRVDSITLNQAVVLIGIYEIILFRELLKKKENFHVSYYRRLTDMFKIFSTFTEEQTTSPDCIVFDFHKCSHLHADYEKLPHEIQKILNPFVKKIDQENEASTSSIQVAQLPNTKLKSE